MCFFQTLFGSKATVTEKDLELARGANYNKGLLSKVNFMTSGHLPFLGLPNTIKVI